MCTGAHQVHPPNAEKCPPSQIGSATKSAVAHPRGDPGNAVLYCSSAITAKGDHPGPLNNGIIVAKGRKTLTDKPWPSRLEAEQQANPLFS